MEEKQRLISIYWAIQNCRPISFAQNECRQVLCDKLDANSDSPSINHKLFQNLCQDDDPNPLEFVFLEPSLTPYSYKILGSESAYLNF